jgi:hypothetical protein
MGAGLLAHTIFLGNELFGDQSGRVLSNWFQWVVLGAWGFLRMKFGERLLDRYPFRGITRPEAASPATGSATSHKIEQQTILKQAFELE